jgi:hypothetical protein
MVPTKNYAGVILYGDYYDLKDLYETIYHVVENFPYNSHHIFKDYALGLCYDIRHAYEGQREIKELGFDERDSAKYYGVKILLPVLLFQYKLIRWFKGFVTITNNHQANLFRLESCIENALKEIDAEIADQCMLHFTYNSGITDKYLRIFIDSLSIEYMEKTKAKRKSSLVSMLNSMSELSPEYRDFHKMAVERAVELNCKPEKLNYNYDEKEIIW